MSHFEVNWLAVVLAMVASMMVGAAWYMTLSRQWLAASGRTAEDITAGGGGASPYVWSALCQLVIAYFLALLTPVLTGGIDVPNAVLVGVHMWLGFIITSMILNHRYQGVRWSLTAIDGGYLLAVVVVQGVVIGLLGA